MTRLKVPSLGVKTLNSILNYQQDFCSVLLVLICQCGSWATEPQAMQRNQARIPFSKKMRRDYHLCLKARFRFASVEPVTYIKVWESLSLVV